MATVVVEARKNGARIPWSYWHDQPLTADEYLAAPLIADPICRYDCDIPVDGVATFVFTTAERARDLPEPAGVRRRLRQRRTRRGRACRCTGRSTTSTRAARRPPAGCGSTRGSDRPTSTCRSCTTASRRSSGSGSRSLGLLPGRRGAPVRRRTAASTATAAGRCRSLSGGGALGNGRMHGVPQMLECYLQLSGRAGDRQRAERTVGLACHSSPHFGGAVVYSAEPLLTSCSAGRPRHHRNAVLPLTRIALTSERCTR